MQRIWYRKSEGAWFLTIRENGRQKQIRLLNGPNTKDTREKAEQLAIHDLASRPQQPSTPAASWITVAHVLDGFLRHSQEDHDPLTYSWYKSLLDPFKARYGDLRIASNSSLPPSANPPGAPKPVIKPKSKRRPGGQPGHPPHLKQLLPPERVAKFR